MKASEILAKRLVIDDSWYGYDSHQVVDIDMIAKDTIAIYYDDYFNSESHIYHINFSYDEVKDMMDGKEVIINHYGEVDVVTKYSLIAE